jgi:AraC-like DNA-binding protein
MVPPGSFESGTPPIVEFSGLPYFALMQATLERQETASRTGSPGMRGETASFASEAYTGEAARNRDRVFESTNSFTAPATGNANDRVLIAAMVNSKIYQDYEKAFSEATGMPVTLRPVESRRMPLSEPDTAVPVRLGDRVIGFLQTGQEDYFETNFFCDKQQESVVKLLSIFAQHLSLLSNQVVVRQEHSEPPVITRAKEYIHEHQTEDISLGQVAKAVNTSTFYFCKLFKKVTGINFTDYLSRMRIERSKNLLLNPNLRVSEIAFEVGFQSLTHFNRVFKKLLGQSPTEYRSQLLGH